MIPVYFRYGDQFIGQIIIDENIITTFSDDYEHHLFNPDNSKAEYIFKEWLDIEKYPPKYFDVNFNSISIYEIKRDTSKTYGPYSDIGKILLYKTKEVIQDKIIYDMYFADYNRIQKIFITPQKMTGNINIYDEYGNLKETFFHIDGKINGIHTSYYYVKSYPVQITTTNYIDGKKHGDYIKIRGKYLTKGYYKNDSLDGDIITTNDDKIKEIRKYENGYITHIKKFYDNGNIYIDNSYNVYKDGSNLLVHNKSYYESGNLFLETIQINKNYHMTHYFDNKNVAWKITTVKSLSGIGKPEIHEMYDEYGNSITEIEFKKKYINIQLIAQFVHHFIKCNSDVDSYSIFEFTTQAPFIRRR